MAALLSAGACGDDGDDATATTTTRPTTTSTSTTTTVPERPISTTTTAFDPTSVEGQVEAAYLKSWDVYADAVYNLELDETALSEVFAEASLTTRRDEIAARIDAGRAALVRLDHAYQIVLVDDSTAAVVDNFVNHQVLIDPVTKAPLEDDPNERLLVNFKLQRIDGAWKVTHIEKVGE
ncbi:MAG TPA: hypothetical protein VFV32_00485 [Acidimicrobiales bacterium]|nr:hypothetical protein [Acidimicrobiales bacterium]